MSLKTEIVWKYKLKKWATAGVSANIGTASLPRHESDRPKQTWQRSNLQILTVLTGQIPSVHHSWAL